jgi:hypothetical protein
VNSNGWECLGNWTYGNCDLFDVHVCDETNLYLGRVVNKKSPSKKKIRRDRECCVVSSRGLCDELITLPEESSLFFVLMYKLYDQ